jgi:hypothetical protein
MSSLRTPNPIKCGLSWDNIVDSPISECYLISLLFIFLTSLRQKYYPQYFLEIISILFLFTTSFPYPRYARQSYLPKTTTNDPNTYVYH